MKEQLKTVQNHYTEEEEKKEKMDTDVDSCFSRLAKVSSDTDGPLKDQRETFIIVFPLRYD